MCVSGLRVFHQGVAEACWSESCNSSVLASRQAFLVLRLSKQCLCHFHFVSVFRSISFSDFLGVEHDAEKDLVQSFLGSVGNRLQGPLRHHDPWVLKSLTSSGVVFAHRPHISSRVC